MMQPSNREAAMARYGGDEFAILLVETPKSGASCYAERIRQALADCPFSHSRQITASFGIASLPEDDLTSSEALIRAADATLYAAKRGGKNSVASYEPETACAQAHRPSLTPASLQVCSACSPT
jgi:diguanylate cyclase (GGDEF)-like protein